MNHCSKIGEIIAFAPSAITVFEQFGIDCYRMAGHPLDEFCAKQGLSHQSLLGRVKDAQCEASEQITLPNWVELPLASVIEHIVQRHHHFARRILSELHGFADSVWERYRRTRPEAARLKTHLQMLERELMMHLLKEEDMVFPHICALESKIEAPASASIFFASVRHPLDALMSVMSDEHDLTDKLLERVSADGRSLDAIQADSGNFAELLQSLKRDLLVHSCLEDFILFPRARALEETHLAP